MKSRTLVLAAMLLAAACSSSETKTPDPTQPPTTPAVSDDQRKTDSVNAVHDTLLADIQDLAKATVDIQAAAPTTTGRGWDATADAAAIKALKDAWVRARTAYERTEGALAPLFPDLDASIDARYDDFLTNLAGQGGDANLFDGDGVTGMHAIERIIFSDVTPPRVVDFEKTLTGYVPASFPKTEQEATDFKTKLCARLVADTKALLDQWKPAVIDIAVAYDGVTSLVEEQREKVNKASSNEEESRYAQRTMTDLRDNLAGTKKAYAIFQAWIISKPGGTDIDKKITDGIANLDAAYTKVSGEGIPAPPATWSAENPSAADLQTPFGQLYTTVRGGVDPENKDSIVSQLKDAGTLLGFKLPGQ